MQKRNMPKKAKKGERRQKKRKGKGAKIARCLVKNYQG